MIVNCCVVRVLEAFDIYVLLKINNMNIEWHRAQDGALGNPKIHVFNLWARVIDLYELFTMHNIIECPYQEVSRGTLFTHLGDKISQTDRIEGFREVG